MSEKIVIYSRLRARRVEGTAGDVIPWLDTDTMSHSILYIRGGNRMALMTIGQVSEMLGVSARMLRYYEKEGLVGSMHRENYAYRVYDEDAVRRIRQIVLLRRLQMPLKRIRVIMDGSAREAAGMVQEQIADMERNLASMGTIRTALGRLRELLGEADSTADRAWERVLEDMAGLLALERYKLNGSALCPISEKEKQIRIVLLPPCTVASFRYFGENPEEKVGSVMDGFIRGEGLYEKKPDSRLFGFNPADGEGNDRSYSYENWVTIPEDLEVPAPLAKKRFAGGLYAAYAIRFPDFQEWDFLKSWAKNNDRYRARPWEDGAGDPEGCLEEHYNWVYSAHAGWPRQGIDGSVDLLLPIQPK